MSRVMSKPAFADQRLCFRYLDSTIPLLSESEIISSEVVQPVLCRNWSETPKIGFLTTRLNIVYTTTGVRLSSSATVRRRLSFTSK